VVVEVSLEKWCLKADQYMYLYMRKSIGPSP